MYWESMCVPADNGLIGMIEGEAVCMILIFPAAFEPYKFMLIGPDEKEMISFKTLFDAQQFGNELFA